MTILEPIFRARMESSKPLLLLLQAITTKSKAQCTITEEGLQFIVRDSSSQFNAYFKSEMTSLFDLNTEELTFTIDIKVLFQCLSIFGSDLEKETISNCELKIDQRNDSLDIMYIILTSLEENGVTTCCELSTFDFQEQNDLERTFIESQVITKVILKSEWLKTAFKEIDNTCDNIRFSFSKEQPFFEIIAKGLAGESRIQYSDDSNVIETFQCEEEMTVVYNFKMIQSSFKALGISTKTSVRINNEGMICLQFLVPISHNHSTFVDIYVEPLENQEVDI
jgi:cell cycle checkpoint protein